MTLKDLKKEFKEHRERNSELHWIKREGVPEHLFHFALRDVNTAFNRYLKKISRKPRFKSVKNTYKSFVQRNDMKQYIKDSIQINKIGKVACDQHQLNRIRQYEGKVVRPTVSYDGLSYYYSVNIEVESQKIKRNKTEPIGIDMGLRTFMTLSTGEKLNIDTTPILHLEKREKRIAKRLGRLYRANRGKNKTKNLEKLEKDKLQVNKRIRDYKQDKIYKMVNDIVKRNPEYVVMEDLNVTGMKRLKPISVRLNKAYFRFTRDQMEYKCRETEIPFYLADRYYPSTKICSSCGEKNNPHNSETYECSVCGNHIDRDFNASLNLKNYPNKIDE